MSTDDDPEYVTNPDYPFVERPTDDPGWIKHDEKRMHLPELAGVCVECLQARVAELAAEVERLSWYEEDYG